MMATFVHTQASHEKLNRVFLLFIIPLLGILIPNITGLISNHRYQTWQLVLSYAYFVFTALLIWKGNVTFLKNIRKRDGLKNASYFKMLLYCFLVNLLYSAIISFSFLFAWQVVSNEPDLKFLPLLYATSFIMVSVILINNVYELVLQRMEIEETMVKFKRMEIAKTQAELGALKAEIDPHFIFNSLNTLSYLITNKPETASYYNDTLARVYRYILLNKDNDLVFLRDELEFIASYFYLIQIRFGDAVKMIIDIPDSKADNYLITPIALQMLIENAIKHNYFSNAIPLVVRIAIESNFVTVRNKTKKKAFEGSSSRIGLKNLKERYQLIMKKDLFIQNDNDEFMVKIPILKS